MTRCLEVIFSSAPRIFWLGQLAAFGRINPQNYENDPDLLGLIDVAPFGLSRVAPVHNRSALKGVHPGIGKDDNLMLWSGGFYNWFDPHTLIRAVADLSTRRPNVGLFSRYKASESKGARDGNCQNFSRT
jgi:hypothetical protein